MMMDKFTAEFGPHAITAFAWAILLSACFLLLVLRPRTLQAVKEFACCFLVGVGWAVFAVLLALGLCGCKSIELPPGAQAQASSVGIDVSPQGPVGPHVTFGSKAITITTAQPDGAANLNRLAVKAPGIAVNSTVATGTVGDEISKIPGGLGAIERFSGDTSSTAPRTDLGQPATDD